MVWRPVSTEFLPCRLLVDNRHLSRARVPSEKIFCRLTSVMMGHDPLGAAGVIFNQFG